MEFKKILDLHVHTDNSFDGQHPATLFCEKGQMLGLRAIAFTDHCDIDGYEKMNLERSVFQSYFEIKKAQSAFRGKMIICTGIELGQPTYDLKTTESVINRLKFDYIICSIHNLRNMQDFYYLDYNKYDVDKLLDEYFDELQILADWGNFDALAHFTYPLRYITGDYKIPVDIKKYDEKINSILEAIIKKDIALEINTSGLRQSLKLTMPDKDIVQKFHDMGGKYITIGSDAHYIEHLGMGIADGMKIAKDCGFDNVTLFQNREPVQIPIE